MMFGSLSLRAALAPILFFGLVADGCALAVGGRQVALSGRIAMAAAMPGLALGLALVVLLLDWRGKRDDGRDDEDPEGPGGGGGGSGPPDHPRPEGEPAWWPRFERQLRDYVHAREREARERVRAPVAKLISAWRR